MDELELWRLATITTILLVGVGLLIANYLLYRRLGQALKNIARQNTKFAQASTAQTENNNAIMLARFNSLNHQVKELVESTIANNNTAQNNQEKLRHRHEKRSDKIDATLKNINRSLAALEKSTDTQKLRDRDQKNQGKIAALTAGLNAAEARSDMLRVELKKLHTYRRNAEKNLSTAKMCIKEREEREAFTSSTENSSGKPGRKP